MRSKSIKNSSFLLSASLSFASVEGAFPKISKERKGCFLSLARISFQAQAHPNSKVILVYGAGHPFESYSGRYFKIEVKDS